MLGLENGKEFAKDEAKTKQGVQGWEDQKSVQCCANSTELKCRSEVGLKGSSCLDHYSRPAGLRCRESGLSCLGSRGTGHSSSVAQTAEAGHSVQLLGPLGCLLGSVRSWT